MNKNQYTLIFVYNARSGAFNAVFDAVHKKVSPNTYKCNLCKITYGITKMDKDWKKFIQNLKLPVEFLHKDEFKKKFDYKNPKFPAVFLKNEHKIKQLISAAEINKSKSVDDLVKLVEDKISSLK
jgi:hypothetical protein